MKKYSLSFILLCFFITAVSQELTVPLVFYTPVCDGIIDELTDPWTDNWIGIQEVHEYWGETENYQFNGEFQMLHTEENLLIAVRVNDPSHFIDTSVFYQNDASEIYFSMDDESGKNGEYGSGCWQIFSFRDKQATGEWNYGHNINSWDISSFLQSEDFNFGQVSKDSSYIQEFIFPKQLLKQDADFDGKNIRFEIAISDNGGTGRTGHLFWHSNSDQQWQNTEYFGRARLQQYQLSLTKKSIDENLPIGTKIGDFAVNGIDLNSPASYRLSLDSTSLNQHFTLLDNVLYSNEIFDYETRSSYTIQLVVEDESGEKNMELIEVRINDLFDSPVSISLSANQVPENAGSDFQIGTLSSDDDDQGGDHTYQLDHTISGNENSLFKIAGNILFTNGTFNFEASNLHKVAIQTSNEQLESKTQLFDIIVTDMNEPPTSISLTNFTVEEGLPDHSLVGLFLTSDEDTNDQFSYELVSTDENPDNNSFVISGDSLFTNEVFSSDEKDRYNIQVKSTDLEGGATSKTLEIFVVNLNHAPSDIYISNSVLDENMEVGTEIGILSSEDFDTSDSHEYHLVVGDLDTNNKSFKIDGNRLLSNEEFDYEVKSVYVFRIQTTDTKGSSFSKSFLISINNVVETGFDVYEKEIVVYPNPVEDRLFYRLIAPEESEAYIISLNGAIHQHFKLNENAGSVSTESLSSGYYQFVVVGNKGEKFIQKFIKK